MNQLRRHVLLLPIHMPLRPASWKETYRPCVCLCTHTSKVESQGTCNRAQKDWRGYNQITVLTVAHDVNKVMTTAASDHTVTDEG
jgi:hypothetical protein